MEALQWLTECIKIMEKHGIARMSFSGTYQVHIVRFPPEVFIGTECPENFVPVHVVKEKPEE